MRRLVAWFRTQWQLLAAAIADARRGPKRAKEDLTILVAPEHGPVVESNDLKDPLPVTRVPVRSTKADGKRLAHRVAEKHAGRKMTWPQAQKYLAKLQRQNPDLELAIPNDALPNMRRIMKAEAM